MLQVFFAIVLGAVGLTQAQMAFPDVAKASGASKRVFSVIDRQPLIQDPPDGETFFPIPSFLPLVPQSKLLLAVNKACWLHFLFLLCLTASANQEQACHVSSYPLRTFHHRHMGLVSAYGGSFGLPKAA